MKAHDPRDKGLFIHDQCFDTSAWREDHVNLAASQGYELYAPVPVEKLAEAIRFGFVLLAAHGGL